MPDTPLSGPAVVQHLRARGVEAPKLAELWTLPAKTAAALRPLANKATRGEARAAQVLTALRKQALWPKHWPAWPTRTRAEPAFRLPARWSRTAVAAADETPVYALEAALWLTAALRHAGEPAQVVALRQDRDARRPADPSATLGAYGVVLTPAKTTSAGPVRLFDPQQGRWQAWPASAVRRLDDLQVAAAVLSNDALTELKRRGKSRAAMRRLRQSSKLDPKSANLRAALALAQLHQGEVETGLKTLRQACALKTVSGQPLLQVKAQMSTGRRANAAATLSRHLGRFPDDGHAWTLRARLLLAERKSVEARQALHKAGGLQHDSDTLALVWAQLHAAAGELDEARRRALALEARLQHDWQHLLELAPLWLTLGDAAHAKQLAERAQKLAPPPQRPMISALLQRMNQAAAATSRAEALPEPDFQLAPKGNSLLDADSDPAPAAASPRLMLGEPEGYRLRPPGARLSLDMDDSPP